MANSKLMAFVIVAAMLLMPSSVVAASISISSVSLPATVNQGDTFTTTMSVSGSSVSSVSGTLTLPSGLSCTPTSSQTISLDSSGVGTGSWSCTASVAGDYTNQITAGVSATDSSTGSSVSDSKQSGLRVLSPASLSVTSSIVAGSVLFTVGVNNVGDTATTFDLSVNCPAGVTCSTTSETGVAIGGNSLVTRTITTDGPAGTYVVTATITPAGQAPTTTSQTVTFEAAATTAAAAAAAGAGGTKTAGQPNATKEIPSIAAGKSAVVTIEKTENVVLRSIEITVINSANNVKVTVIKLADKPAIVTQDVSGTVYHFIQVDKIGLTDTNVAKAKVKFAVEKSWISANKIDPMTVALQRYQQSGWNKLATVKVGETADEIEYEAESPGLSVFAVTGQPIIPSQPPTEEQKKEAAATTPTSYGSSLMGILVIIAIVAAAVYYNKNRGRKRTSALKASR